MFRSVAVVLLALSSTTAFAAVNDPQVTDSSNNIPGVVTTCSQVSVAERAGDNSLRGHCIAATETFLDIEKAAPKVSIEQSATDLVIALVPLVTDDDDCNEFDTEVATAIRIAGGYAQDPDQRARFLEIADTIEACDVSATAAIDLGNAGSTPGNSLASPFGG